MKKLYVLLLAIVMGLTAFPAFATLEETYNPSEPQALTAWYGRVDAAAQQADRRFISGMRPHHAGALTMSDDYLNDKAARHNGLQQLARGIIHNQKFEIGMLDSVEAYLEAAQSDSVRPVGQVAAEGLAQQQKFFRAPVPGPLDLWAGSREVSARDVQFAKAMIIHHEAALVMAREYLRDPDAGNGYLRQMCLDILLDQAQEIAFMHGVIDDYAGNPDDVKIDASMIHGMEGMNHGGMSHDAPMDHSAMKHGGAHH